MTKLSRPFTKNQINFVTNAPPIIYKPNNYCKEEKSSRKIRSMNFAWLTIISRQPNSWRLHFSSTHHQIYLTLFITWEVHVDNLRTYFLEARFACISSYCIEWWKRKLKTKTITAACSKRIVHPNILKNDIEPPCYVICNFCNTFIILSYS